MCILHGINNAFAGLSYGPHSIRAIFFEGLLCSFISMLLRWSLNGSIFPFESLMLGIFGGILVDIVISVIKIVPRKDPRKYICGVCVCLFVCSNFSLSLSFFLCLFQL